MKKILIIITLLHIVIAHSQRQNENWYFGENAGVNFSTVEAQPLTNGVMNAFEGSATVSDSMGNLLFYTNGITVWNRNHEIMQNGEGLLGHFSSTQSPVIVPVPGSANRYYIFTTGAYEEPGGLNYSEVDMELNGGLGAVTSVKNVILFAAVSEQLTATFHNNGHDIWLLCNGVDAFFNAFLITDAGILTAPVKSSNALVVEDPINYPGCAKFSPDGSKLAVMQYTTGAYLYDFNNNTGVVSNRLVLSDDDSAWYGTEFSASGRYLYMAQISETLIAQYDLQAQDIPASQITILENPLVMGGALQRAINGKIYATHANFIFLSVVHSPDNGGAGSEIDEHGVSVGFRRLSAGLPSPVLWPVDFAITAEDVCDGTAVEFDFLSATTFTEFTWDFGDGTTSSEANPTHLYTQPGTYTATLTGTTPATTRVATTTLTVKARPALHLENEYVLCSGGAITVTAPGFDTYSWSNGGDGEELVITQPGNYALTVTSNGCEATGEFEVTLKDCYEIPKGVSPNSDGFNDNFDLAAMNVTNLRIFNRYGVMVFSEKNYISQWQGQTGDGKELPAGIYYYVIENALNNYTGWVYLNREHKN